MLHAILIFALIIQSGQKQSGQKQENSATWLLHRAAIRGETSSVEMMINLGADVNAPDQQGRTPLHDACLKGHLDTAKLLLVL
jgi:ankyrin repeat protein